ncbi:MAG TPA: lysine--tRNA ligase [Candidatus Limnocylindrales bacterium]|nr:lysine--tRNA ligase [Candidatus Limnocylindrales bacterium]
MDWVNRFADEVLAAAGDGPIVCASGMSPSGPIHMGKLREVMTPHLVADEILRRGRECVHIVSWDDYDRFRRVPAGVDQSWSRHIGKPLTSVPAPEGSEHANYAEYFKAPMAEALRRLGIEYVGVSQTEKYTSGYYRDQVLLAMRERRRIDAILERYRTLAIQDEDPQTAKGEYFPYKHYCDSCERDFTTITAYDDASTKLSYVCACGHEATINLSEHFHGKLVWKVDWPMRWAVERVLFEPSGVDHSSPGSSYVVGGEIVTQIFGARQPIGPMYAFVGIKGMAKMSSSKGNVPTPLEALRLVEPQLLRWLYARRRPNQAFDISFDQEIHRLYDEWDSLGRKVSEGSASPADATAHDRAVRAAASTLPTTRRPFPYRTMTSIVDITTGDPAQVLRILRDLDPADPIDSLEDARPRLDCATAWTLSQVPLEERTRLKETPDQQELTEGERESLRLLLDGLEADWSLPGLTRLIYGVPKRRLGLPMDTAPTPELKAAQREFFILLYRRLIGRDTGPRLPTLLLAAGPERIRRLLSLAGP